jgi:hypothetical protein
LFRPIWDKTDFDGPFSQQVRQVRSSGTPHSHDGTSPPHIRASLAFLQFAEALRAPSGAITRPLKSALSCKRPPKSSIDNNDNNLKPSLKTTRTSLKQTIVKNYEIAAAREVSAAARDTETQRAREVSAAARDKETQRLAAAHEERKEKRDEDTKWLVTLMKGGGVYASVSIASTQANRFVEFLIIKLISVAKPVAVPVAVPVESWLSRFVGWG